MERDKVTAPNLLEDLAEHIAEGVWDVPAIETRDEFKFAVRGALEKLVRECAEAAGDVEGSFSHGRAILHHFGLDEK